MTNESWTVTIPDGPGNGTAPDVLVLDAQHRQSLATMRSLTRSGITVGGVACRAEADWAPALRSRWCRLRAIVPDFEDDPKGYAESVVNLLDAYPAQLILPAHDGSIQALRSRRPSAPGGLRDRVEGRVAILRQTSVVSASAEGGKALLRVRNANGIERVLEVDHVISATEYEANVDHLTFLRPELAGQIRRIERAPALSPYFESSVPGLYFVGPVAAFSFGPLVRFVCGAAYTTPKVARHITRSVRK